MPFQCIRCDTVPYKVPFQWTREHRSTTVFLQTWRFAICSNDNMLARNTTQTESLLYYTYYIWVQDSLLCSFCCSTSIPAFCGFYVTCAADVIRHTLWSEENTVCQTLAVWKWVCTSCSPASPWIWSVVDLRAPKMRSVPSMWFIWWVFNADR